MMVGLGNPGPRYARTRHNVGFAVVQTLAARWGATGTPRRVSNALVWDAQVAGERCLLVRPHSFMNRSGAPTQALAAYYDVAPSDVTVVHDELDLPYGTVRCKVGGGHGGHNGLRDIARLFSRDTVRIRCGIGRPPPQWEAADYVLSRWTDEEAETLDGVIDKACDAAEEILRDGPQAAMNRHNQKPRPQKPRSRNRSRGDTAEAEPLEDNR